MKTSNESSTNEYALFFKQLANRTQDVYNRRGSQYNAERAKILFEREWLIRFQSLLPKKATILDVGCGSGEPISQFFIENGHDVTGIDYAKSMIALARSRFPDSHWQVADMRELSLDTSFDGIIGWHSFFHLTPDEQRHTLHLFAQCLEPGGALMITVGPAAGEVIGYVGGEEVYHSSLSPDEYREILRTLNFEVVDFVLDDPECDFATILLATKKKGDGVSAANL